jgi:hypothetical protein
MRKKILATCLVLMMTAFVNGFQSATQWVKYDSAEGRYGVLMPEQPKLATQEGATPTGKKMTQYQARATDSDSMFAVGYFDLLPDATYSLDNGRDGIIKAVNGTLLSEKQISLGESPGREFNVSAKASEGEFLMRVRLYEIGGRVYVLQHVFLKSSDSPAIAEKTVRFFDSFKVTTSK